MRNVQWVEVQPFHQLGAFKWKAMGLDYPEHSAVADAGIDGAGSRPVPGCRMQRAMTQHHPGPLMGGG